MQRYILRRLTLLMFVMWGVLTATFLLMRVAPGDPARQYLGDKANVASLQALRHTWGLDQPLILQYFQFLWDVIRGSFGDSLSYQVSNVSIIGDRLPVTLMLMLLAVIFAILIAAPVASWVALRGRGLSDSSVRLSVAVTQGVPSFLIAMLMIMVFALGLRWFPVGGYGRTITQHFVSLVLPAFTLGLAMTPVLINSMRDSLRHALGSEYVSFARVKGLHSVSVIWRYAIRNASTSTISLLGLQMGGLAGGALVIENVFALPGVGSAMMNGILSRDFPLVQALTVIFAGLVALINLLTDLAYAYVDPRVKLQ